MKKSKKIISNILIIILLAIVIFCAFKIYKHYADEAEYAEDFSRISASAEQTDEKGVLERYNELHLQNKDMAGWIKIDGTTVNYPVMQTPSSPNYYLRRNFDKEYSAWGTPYIQENCNLAESDNIIIYGHHIRGDKMFGALKKYTSQDFFKEHGIIKFDTLTRRDEYQIIAVFKTTISAGGYRYYDYVGGENEKAFNDYVAKCKELSLYDTGITAVYGDKLITLSTCEYSADNGRLVVVAKRIS